MITRSILIEQVRRRLAGGEVPNNFPITVRDTGKMVDQVANAAIKITCLNEGWDNFLTPYENVPVLFDSAKNLYYCVIKQSIGFKNQDGVFQVSTMEDQVNIFTPMPANTQWQFSENMNLILGNSVGYYNEQKKIYLINYSPSEDANELLVKLVVDRSELDDEEDYKITPELEKLILQEVFNFFQPK